MKKLYLLRHAESPMSFDTNDKDRTLSLHGIAQAKSVAEHLKSIDHVLCSNALRTKMTCNTVVESGAQFGKVEYLDELYNAPADALLKSIHSCDAQSIMVIAHNPGIHMLAAMLAGEGNQTNLEKLNLFYNPASLSIFDCDIENWSDIQPSENTLVDLIIPS
jgi:phosphohistidine phosphatase